MRDESELSAVTLKWIAAGGHADQGLALDGPIESGFSARPGSKLSRAHGVHNSLSGPFSLMIPRVRRMVGAPDPKAHPWAGRMRVHGSAIERLLSGPDAGICLLRSLGQPGLGRCRQGQHPVCRHVGPPGPWPQLQRAARSGPAPRQQSLVGEAEPQGPARQLPGRRARLVDLREGQRAGGYGGLGGGHSGPGIGLVDLPAKAAGPHADLAVASWRAVGVPNGGGGLAGV
jgi:hypothetical protein